MIFGIMGVMEVDAVQAAQHPRAGEGELQMQPVEMPHDGKIGLRHRPRQVVDAAAADTKNLGLLGDRQIVPAVDLVAA